MTRALLTTFFSAVIACALVGLAGLSLQELDELRRAK
jgi:hypothetical protein